MSALDLRRVPVVEGRRVVGVLTRADVEAYSQLQDEFGNDADHVSKEISPRDGMY
jgi:CBS domain-containing protein